MSRFDVFTPDCPRIDEGKKLAKSLLTDSASIAKSSREERDGLMRAIELLENCDIKLLIEAQRAHEKQAPHTTTGLKPENKHPGAGIKQKLVLGEWLSAIAGGAELDSDLMQRCRTCGRSIAVLLHDEKLKHKMSDTNDPALTRFLVSKKVASMHSLVQCPVGTCQRQLAGCTFMEHMLLHHPNIFKVRLSKLVWERHVRLDMTELMRRRTKTCVMLLMYQLKKDVHDIRDAGFNMRDSFMPFQWHDKQLYLPAILMMARVLNDDEETASCFWVVTGHTIASLRCRLTLNNRAKDKTITATLRMRDIRKHQVPEQLMKKPSTCLVVDDETMESMYDMTTNGHGTVLLTYQVAGMF